jgi:hypothetical protein
MATNLSYALCPNCNKEAKGKTKVIELFGTRNNGGYLMVQSHCRECRKQESVQRERLGLRRHRS